MFFFFSRKKTYKSPWCSRGFYDDLETVCCFQFDYQSVFKFGRFWHTAFLIKHVIIKKKTQQLIILK